jgi:hypothetical protein
MTRMRIAFAAAAGLLLATMPLWRYTPGGGTGEGHQDHEPRHGGQLGMVGDAHIEVVRRLGAVEMYVSDARRRPVQPAAGWVVFDRAERRALRWRGHRLVGDDLPAAREIEAVAQLDNGTTLALSFDFGAP